LSDRKTGSSEKFAWEAEHDQKPERAIVLVPVFAELNPRNNNARLEEAIGLANAISLDVIESGIIPIKAIKPATLFGSGKVDEITGIIKSSDIGLAIIDHAISPKQQQNLEEAWNCKVLDRTGLILEIFGERAQTKEGTLQVELAHLNYQKGRLVRSWTHLERQRGGLGSTGLNVILKKFAVHANCIARSEKKCHIRWWLLLAIRMQESRHCLID